MPADRGMWLYATQSPTPPYPIAPAAATVSTWNSAHAVKNTYVGATAGAVVDATWLAFFRALKTSAVAAGGKLFAAAGDPTWADANYNAATWAVNVLQAKEANGVTRLFDGVMLDVEPYPFWTGGVPTQTQLLNWLAMHQNVKAEVAQNYCNPVGSPTAKAWFALPVWLNNYSITGAGMAFDRSLLTASDGVMFMSYRDTVGPAPGPNGSILSISSAARASAIAVGRDYRLGVETINTGIAYETYYGQSRSAMEADMNAVSTALVADTRYKGIDVHHYSAWAAQPA